MKFLLIVSMLLSVNFLQAQKVKKALPDSTQIKNTLTGFYKWYDANWQKLTAFKLYKGKNQNDEPPYRINWKEVDRYFAYLRKNSSHLSEAFIEEERERFKRIEQDFQNHPEEEIPSGFDYDRFTNTQEEPSYFLQELLRKDNQWQTYVNGNTASLSIAQPSFKEQPLATHHFFCVEMRKEKGKWKITRLDCDLTENSIEEKPMQ